MIFLIDVVRIAFDIMYWLIIVRVLLSWVPHDPYQPIFKFIYEVTEIILGPVRRYIPLRTMGIDFSPIIALLLLQLIESLVINLLYSLLF